MASTMKLNYDGKDLAIVVNYDCKCDTTIWSNTIWSVPYNRKTFKVQGSML
jgi:hypothetical protein